MRKYQSVAKVRSRMHSKTIDLNYTVVLDERIDEFAEIIREQFDVDELGDPSATSEVQFFSSSGTASSFNLTYVPGGYCGRRTYLR